MAYVAATRQLGSDLGGSNLHKHLLGHDVPPRSHRTDRQAGSSLDTSSSSNMLKGSQSSDLASGDGEQNEDDDDDDDSSLSEPADDDGGDDDDDPDVRAPFRGMGKGKGKGMRPTSVNVLDESEPLEDVMADVMSGTGHKTSGTPDNFFAPSKKRTLSDASNTSVLFEDAHDGSMRSRPRRKHARTISNGTLGPLLRHDSTATEDQITSEHAIDSDDEDYSAVNLVPDDDETDMDTFEDREEKFIIQDEERQPSALRSQYSDARRMSLDSHASDHIFDMTAPLGGEFPGATALPDLGFGQFFETQPIPSSPALLAKRKFSDSSTKRVRFDDEIQVSDSSSTSSSELDSALYPDLFLDQDKLPPSLSQLLDNDNDEDNGDFDSPESERSFWDCGEDGAPASGASVEEDFDESSDPGSSGYETDMGDTTDEYDSEVDSDINPQTPVRKMSVLHRPMSALGSRTSSPKPFERSTRPVGRAIPPTRGIFIHEDTSKAIAITSRTTNALTFFRPRASMLSRTPLGRNGSIDTADNSPRTSVNQLNVSDSDASNDVLNNALATDIMLTGIFGAAPTNDFYFGTDSIGPPEAFYPFVSVGTNGLVVDHADDYDGDEDFEEDLNIADFMDFGDDADATDLEQEDEETDVPATPATSAMAVDGSTPARQTPLMDTPGNRKRNVSDAMLEHFDRGVVTAFRNNQSRYRDIACLPSDPSIRASVSKPIRSGKSAEALMTPLRKRSGSRRLAKSPFQPSSPLTGVTKASSRLHKSLLNAGRAPHMGTFS